MRPAESRRPDVSPLARRGLGDDSPSGGQAQKVPGHADNQPRLLRQRDPVEPGRTRAGRSRSGRGPWKTHSRASGKAPPLVGGRCSGSWPAQTSSKVQRWFAAQRDLLDQIAVRRGSRSASRYYHRSSSPRSQGPPLKSDADQGAHRRGPDQSASPFPRFSSRKSLFRLRIFCNRKSRPERWRDIAI